MSQILTDGNDYITASQSEVYGLNGNDRIFTSQPGPDLYGGNGSDFLGNNGTGVMYGFGGDGNDTVHGGESSDFIYGERGDDLLVGGEFSYAAANGGSIIPLGSEPSGEDYLDGGEGRDSLWGFEGNDTLLGGDGDDSNVFTITVKDYQGADTYWSALNGGLYGGDGDDYLDGGRGNDYLDGGTGADRIIGGDGDDTLHGGSGVDTMSGGAGNDTYHTESAGDLIFEARGEGSADKVLSSASYTLGTGQEIEIFATTLQSGNTAINLTGNEFAQIVNGNNGVNNLNGLSGVDTMSGFAGNDIIAGGNGNDILTGGTGADTFVFNYSLNSVSNRDTITDFTTADVIHLENAIFTSLIAQGVPLNAAFFKTGAAADSNDYILYNQTTGVLSYDKDGNGAAGASQIAVLSTHPIISAADFFVV